MWKVKKQELWKKRYFFHVFLLFLQANAKKQKTIDKLILSSFGLLKIASG